MKWPKYMAIILIILIALGFTPIDVLANKEGIVNASTLNVREAPSASSSIVGNLSKGMKVSITGTQGDWSQISFQGKTAFVATRFIDVVQVPKQTQPVSIYVNDAKLILPIEPLNRENRLLVPFRVIAEALNIEVLWDDKKRQVIAIDSDTKVVFTIDRSETVVNDQVVNVTPFPVIVTNHTVIPLRFFSETFGAEVKWDDATKTVDIKRQIKVPEIEKPLEEEPKKDANLEILDGNLPLEKLVGVVDVATLNVRSKPDASSSLVTKVTKGTNLPVLALVDQWVETEIQGIKGYVHSSFVNLTFDSQIVKLLMKSKLIEEDNFVQLSWNKYRHTAVTTTKDTATIIVNTTATFVEEFQLNSELVVNSISTTPGIEGHEIKIELKEGYTSIIQDTPERLTIVIFKEMVKGKRVVIDPGHGGKDPGAIANSLRESNVVLNVSLELKELLTKAGFDVILTRENDSFLSLKERVDLATMMKADLFISIHANAATTTAAKGTETYWNRTYAGQESLKLATSIHDQLIAELGTNNRGVKHANFQVITQATMPSVLLELAFLSNVDDAKLIASKDFSSRSAKAINDGILLYFK